MAVRLFLAINPDAETRRSIAEAIGPLREAAPDLRWTDASRVHLTLKFFGEQDESAVSTLSALADDLADRVRPFAIRFSQVGAFPNFRRARVVWLGIEHEARLELLHHDVEVASERRGFELEGRPFRPHLTLARVPEGTDVEVLRRLSRAAKAVQLDEECVVESIDLMRSRLGPGGASHERLHAARLVS
jgi:RNA 2',3'-cyclic 3'-phosphodiesterase